MKKTIAVSAALVFVLPALAHAQVVVSEVMYDLAEGSDVGREWIEVFNSGSSGVDLTLWKLYEAETNHKITEVAGGTSLPGGGYAIVADNAAKFLADYPAYSGILFDSTFSLTNTGETLVLRNADLADKDSISFNPDMGGAGDGNSIQRASVGGKVFAAASPTPGIGTLSVSAGGDESGADMSGGGVTQPQGASQTQASATPAPVSEPQVFAYAGKDRTVIVGADTVFEGRALGRDGELLAGSGVRYLWTFGDGAVSEGRSIFHHFAHPGKYVVVLDVSSGAESASARITVSAEPARFTVAVLPDGSVAIENKSQRELNLSFWHIASGAHRFLIPKDTIILAVEQIIVPVSILGFRAEAGAMLLYPNGTVASSIEPEKPTIQHVSVSAPQKTSAGGASAAPVPRAEVAPESKGLSQSPPNESQAANAVVSYMIPPSVDDDSGERGLLNSWTLGFVVLLALGGAGAFFASRARREWQIDETM